MSRWRILLLVLLGLVVLMGASPVITAPIASALRTSSGAVLYMGAPADGENLCRSGTTIAGCLGSSLGGSTGATDNRVLRADGTGGATLQSSAATLDDSGNLSGLGATSTTTIELGHASDTTLARTSAGNVAVEGNALYRVGGTDVALADGGTGVGTALEAADVFGARRVQALVWYPSAASPGLIGDVTASGSGTHAFGSTGTRAHARRTISATTGAYGWSQTATLHWWVGAQAFTDVTLRFDVKTNQRLYSGMLVSNHTGARSSGPAGIYFVFDDPAGDTTWRIQTSTGAARDATDTGVTVAVNTWYRLRWELANSGATVNWWIWSSASDPAMVGVTPTTGSVSPGTIPTAQASGFEAALGQPSASSTVAIDCFQAQAGQVP